MYTIEAYLNVTYTSQGHFSTVSINITGLKARDRKLVKELRSKDIIDLPSAPQILSNGYLNISLSNHHKDGLDGHLARMINIREEIKKGLDEAHRFEKIKKALDKAETEEDSL